MLIFHLIKSGNFNQYNRQLGHLLGLHEAILLCYLLDEWSYAEKEDKLVSHPKWGDGWAWQQVDFVEERTCLSRRMQDSALNALQKKGLVEVQSFGMPNKRHIRFTEKNEEKLVELLKGFQIKSANMHQNAKLVGAKAPNQFVPKRQTGAESVYDNEPYLSEPKEEYKAACAALTSLLLEKLKRVNPLFSDSTKSWEKHWIVLLKKRGQPKIEELIAWAMDNPFWMKVLVSPHGLISHLSKLEAGKNCEKETPSQKVEEHRKMAQLIKDKHFKNDMNVSVGPDYFERVNGPKCDHMLFGSEQFESFARKYLGGKDGLEK